MAAPPTWTTWTPGAYSGFPLLLSPHHNNSGGRNGWTGRQKGSNTRLPTLCAAPSASGRPKYAATDQRLPAEPQQPPAANKRRQGWGKTGKKRAAMARMHSPRNGTGPAAIAAQIGRRMSYIIPMKNYITSPSPYVRRDRRRSWLLPSLHPCPHRSGAIRSQTVTVPAD